MAITRTQIARQLYRFGGDTMGGSTNNISLEEAKDMAPKGEFLAYINEKEAKMLKDAGGSGIMTNAGIPSFVEYGGRSGFDSAKSTGSVQGDVDRGPGGGGGPKGPPSVINPPKTNPVLERIKKRNIPSDSPFKKFLAHDRFTDMMKASKTPNYHQMGGLDFMARFPDINPDVAKGLASAYQTIFEGARAIADGPGGVTFEDAGKKAAEESRLNAIGIDAFSDPNSETYKQYTSDTFGLKPAAVQMADGGRAGLAEGGMPYEGGILDLESARQMYGFGKLVKKVTRSVKKIAKSPIGKAALLYTGLGGLGSVAGGGTFFGNFANPINQLKGVGSIFSKGGFENILARAKLGSFSTTADVMKPVFEKNFLGKALTSPSGLIAGTSLIAGALTAEQEEEAQQIADNTGIDIAEIRANPDKYLGRRFRAEGGSMDEPVAKKTMPLLDMGGKEMDLRAEGGFVPIGRMEKADDVPARLSKNEFVFTADAVRNAGEGDVDKGAEVMYNMMKNLESGGDVSEESQGLEGARKMFQTSQRLEEVL